MNLVYLVVFFVVVIFIIFLLGRRSSEKYYLRDIPFGLGFGGFPPGLYSRRFVYNYPRRGLYGAPIRYGERGYDPGMGLTWD